MDGAKERQYLKTTCLCVLEDKAKDEVHVPATMTPYIITLEWCRLRNVNV